VRSTGLSQVDRAARLARAAHRPELRNASATQTAAVAPPTPDHRRQLAEASVPAQFQTIAAAAQDCDILVGATAPPAADNRDLWAQHAPRRFRIDRP
jgi:hypothetical protein